MRNFPVTIARSARTLFKVYSGPLEDCACLTNDLHLNATAPGRNTAYHGPKTRNTHGLRHHCTRPNSADAGVYTVEAAIGSASPWVQLQFSAAELL